MGVILDSSAVVAGERKGGTAAELQAERRRRFLEDVFSVVPAYPLTFEIARRAARIDAESKGRGVAIPFQDLIIGVTALEFDYSVATLNVRHFEMIPDLVVTAL